MSTVNVTIRMDENLKKQADVLFSELGMNMSTAFTVFAKQAVREQAIPFNIEITPNAQTLAAIEEVRLMKKDRTVGKSYTDAHEMIEDLLK